MRIESEALIRCRLVNSTADVAELAKIAAKAGYTLTMRPPNTSELPLPGYVVTMQRDTEVPLSEDLFWLAYVAAYAGQRTVRQVLDDLLAEFERRHAPVDSILQDFAGIGDADPDHEQ